MGEINSNFLLCDTLTDFQLKLLELIQYLRENLKRAGQKNLNRNGEPIITLQYSYIVSVLKCSHKSVSDGLQRLCDIELLKRVSNELGECATYQYNPSVYTSLIRKAKKRNCVLTTGRNKQSKELTADEVLKYMTGKAIVKASKRRKKTSKPL